MLLLLLRGAECIQNEYSPGGFLLLRRVQMVRLPAPREPAFLAPESILWRTDWGKNRQLYFRFPFGPVSTEQSAQWGRCQQGGKQLTLFLLEQRSLPSHAGSAVAECSLSLCITSRLSPSVPTATVCSAALPPQNRVESWQAARHKAAAYG